MIAYHILCHDNFPQVAQLVDALYSEEDVFLIDIDNGKNPDTRALDKYQNRSNIHVNRDANIGWGGSGTLRKTLQGALRLLELDQSWRYYIVLSGQDLPLKSNESIKRSLAEGDKHQTSFIRAFKKPEIDLAGIPINNAGDQPKLWGDRGHTKVYAEPGTIDPQVDMYARVLVDVTESAYRGEVFVGTADSLLLKRRGEFFRKYPLYVGANWFNLHRSVIEYMHDDSFTYELYDVLKTTFIPDESYFQTYIKNSPFRDKTSQQYGRLILRPGHKAKVKVFEMTDWPEIEASADLFGRKFDARHDKNIVARVLADRY